MITTEQARQMLETTYEAWATQYPDRANQLTDSDQFLLGKSLGNRLKIVGHIGVSDLERAMKDFEERGESNGATGKLSFQQQLAPPNPALNLPFSDEPELRRLRCVEDIIENGAAISKKILSLGGHGIGGSRNSLLDRMNERLQYVQVHNIQREDLPDEPEEKAQPRQVVINRPREIAEALTAIDKMNLSDVGQTNSSSQGGRRASLAKKQARLRAEVEQMWREGKKPSETLAWCLSEIKRFGESSIC